MYIENSFIDNTFPSDKHWRAVLARNSVESNHTKRGPECRVQAEREPKVRAERGRGREGKREGGREREREGGREGGGREGV